jgi:hypothetical protein
VGPFPRMEASNDTEAKVQRQKTKQNATGLAHAPSFFTQHLLTHTLVPPSPQPLLRGPTESSTGKRQNVTGWIYRWLHGIDHAVNHAARPTRQLPPLRPRSSKSSSPQRNNATFLSPPSSPVLLPTTTPRKSPERRAPAPCEKPHSRLAQTKQSPRRCAPARARIRRPRLCGSDPAAGEMLGGLLSRILL